MPLIVMFEAEIAFRPLLGFIVPKKITWCEMMPLNTGQTADQAFFATVIIIDDG
jgi:hypothetical protein